jgi:hypothetical protein
MLIQHRRVISSWIAILAILLNALMPTVSLARESSRGESAVRSGDWVEVCFVQGSSWVRQRSRPVSIAFTARSTPPLSACRLRWLGLAGA